MSNVCGICKTSFKTKSGLTKHKKTAQYCHDTPVVWDPSVPTEEDDTPEIVPSKLLQCKYCDYQTKIKANHKRHQTGCKHKPTVDEDDIIYQQLAEIEDLKDQIKTQAEQIKTLQKEIEELKIELRVVYDIQLRRNPGKVKRTRKLPDERIPFTLKTVEDAKEQFTFDLYREGTEGLARFIRKLSNDGKSYFCSDAARLKFIRITGPGDKDFVSESGPDFVFEVFETLRQTYLDTLNQYSEDIRKIKYMPSDTKQACEVRGEAISKTDDFDALLGTRERDGKLYVRIKDRFCRQVAKLLSQADFR